VAHQDSRDVVRCIPSGLVEQGTAQLKTDAGLCEDSGAGLPQHALLGMGL
jgi:hypothetical protein